MRAGSFALFAHPLAGAQAALYARSAEVLPAMLDRLVAMSSRLGQGGRWPRLSADGDPPLRV